MNRAAASAGAVVGLVALGVLGWWGASSMVTDDVRTDGPLQSYRSHGTGQVGGTIHGEMLDWAEIALVNTSPDPAVISRVELLPGGGSDQPLQTDGFFVLGLDRAFGGGMTDAPSDATYWGVDPEPASGHTIPGTGEDSHGTGLVLLVRLGIGDQSDGSFSGVVVSYTWHGDDYQAHYDYLMLICDAAKSGRLPDLCRGEPRPSAPVGD